MFPRPLSHILFCVASGILSSPAIAFFIGDVAQNAAGARAAGNCSRAIHLSAELRRLLTAGEPAG
jgi:hypothetical protein